MLNKVRLTIFTTVVTATSHSAFAATADRKFICDGENGAVIIAELNLSDESVNLTIKGPIADAIATDFTNKPSGFYDQIQIRTTTAGVVCPFAKESEIYFRCFFHRYSSVRAVNSHGDSEFLKVNTDQSSFLKGGLLDLYEGGSHHVSVRLYAKEVHERTYTSQFGPSECKYTK